MIFPKNAKLGRSYSFTNFKKNTDYILNVLIFIPNYLGNKAMTC